MLRRLTRERAPDGVSPARRSLRSREHDTPYTEGVKVNLRAQEVRRIYQTARMELASRRNRPTKAWLFARSYVASGRNPPQRTPANNQQKRRAA